MSERLVECVPNFSEGRDLGKIELILDAVRKVPGVAILDVDPGAETNRTVVTLVGAPEVIGDAAVAAVARAAEVLDMSNHTGTHARHGATDVCPFVPVSGVTMDECIDIARSVGKRIGEELGIPVYMYDQAALLPSRRSLAKVRAGEYEALPEKMKDEAWKPDFGPAEFHAKAGVVTVGAREFLIAYNVNLNSRHKMHADDIAGEVRETGRAVRLGQTSGFYVSGSLLKYAPSKGRWPCAYCESVEGDRVALTEHYSAAHERDLDEEFAFFGRNPEALEGVNVMKRGSFSECRGVGWVIPEYNRAQISLNLTNYKVTPAHTVLEECRELARDRGLSVTGSELVGLVPYAAIRESGEAYLEKQGASRGVPVADVVETAAQSMGLRDVGEFEAAKAVLGLPTTDGSLASMKLNEFADEISRSTPAPGGGSVAALAGSLGAALAAMVSNLSHAKKGMEDQRSLMEQTAMELQVVKDDLLRAVDADTDAFNDVLAGMRMPKGSPEEKTARDAAIQEGYKLATSVPLQTAELCLQALRHCRVVAEKGLPASVTDAGVGALLARAGVLGGIYNVRINLPSITDESWVAAQRGQLDALQSEAESLEAQVRACVEAAF
jgi:glutamate formiminotransferase / formiminotetrahydrofolate cyclodeaminase